MKTVAEYYQDIQPLIENEWYQAAISSFEHLLQTNPTFARGHYELGTLHYKFGVKDKVLDCYKKAVEYDPDNIDYLKSLADFYHAELEQIEPALAAYKRIIARGHNDVKILFIAANLCVALHDFEAAANYYQKVLEIEPWHSEAFDYLEKIKNHQKPHSQPDSPDEFYQQSLDAGAGGNIQMAVSILEQLVGQHPDYAPAHNDLGVYYQKLGNNDQAGYHYQNAIRLEPFNNIFKKNFANFCYVVQGDVVAALNLYLDVLRSDPKDVEVLQAAGDVSRAVNKLENAKTFYTRVLELEPWNMEISKILNRLEEDARHADSAGINS